MIDCPSQDYITDRHCKIVTTPAFMNKKSWLQKAQKAQKTSPQEKDLTQISHTPQTSPQLFFEVHQGIRGLTKEIIEMA